MGTNDNINEARLKGKWEAVAMYSRDSGEWRWTYQYDPGAWQLEFCTDCKLIESSTDCGQETTLYDYNPRTHDLWIDRSVHEVDGAVSARIRDHYQIIRLTDRLMWLYDMDDTDKKGRCSGAYLFRHILLLDCF